MAEVTLTLDLSDDLIAAVRIAAAMEAEDDGSALEAVWEEAQDAVLDAVRMSFNPTDLLEDDAE